MTFLVIFLLFYLYAVAFADGLSRHLSLHCPCEWMHKSFLQRSISGFDFFTPLERSRPALQDGCNSFLTGQIGFSRRDRVQLLSDTGHQTVNPKSCMAFIAELFCITVQLGLVANNYGLIPSACVPSRGTPTSLTSLHKTTITSSFGAHILSSGKNY